MKLEILGLYKVDAGADRENTPTQSVADSEALISSDENIFKLGSGDMYISRVEQPGRVVKLSNDQLSVLQKNLHLTEVT